GFRERDIILAHKFRRAQRRRVLALVEETRRAEAMIGVVEHAAEFLADRAFRPRTEIVLPPETLDERPGLRLAAGREMRARERNAAGRRRWRLLAETFAHDAMRRLAGIKRDLEAGLQETGRRPVG